MYIHTYIQGMYMPHFLYPSSHEHLGCFHMLAIVHNAAMDIGLQISFQVILLFSLDKCTEVESVGHIMEEPPYCFP